MKIILSRCSGSVDGGNRLQARLLQLQYMLNPLGMSIALAKNAERGYALSQMAKIPKAALEFFRKEGSKGGKKSAAARMEKLTQKQRSEIAKKAAAARWGTKRKSAKQSAA